IGIEGAQATSEAVSSARAALAKIERLLTEHVGPARALDFGPLGRPLARIGEFVAARVATLDNNTREGAGAQETERSEEGAGSGTAAHAVLTAGPAKPRQIASARDVSDALDAICAYYAQSEPSSPLPVLLQRARRLVGASFMEIIEDVAPDGAAQFKHLGGIA
ncbi:MAG: ImpA family type VI secretion system protein, partial [Trinickia sp.]